MSEETAPLGVVIAHGSLAQGLVDAARKISGAPEGVLVPLSNEGRSPQALQEDLLGLLEGNRALIFTDLPSGSCAVTALTCCRADPELTVITGVNLPMLLDFVFNRQLPVHELVPRLLSKGSASMTSTPEHPAHVRRSLPG